MIENHMAMNIEKDIPDDRTCCICGDVQYESCFTKIRRKYICDVCVEKIIEKQE